MLRCHERSTFIYSGQHFSLVGLPKSVHHAEREFGDSKYSLVRLINLMYDTVTCLTTTPLPVGTCWAALSPSAGLACRYCLLYFAALGPQWAAEGVFMLFAVLFTFIGAQFIGMGLLGEYIGRIYNDVAPVPLYFVQQVIYPESTPFTEGHQWPLFCYRDMGSGCAGRTGCRVWMPRFSLVPTILRKTPFGSVPG